MSWHVAPVHRRGDVSVVRDTTHRMRTHSVAARAQPLRKAALVVQKSCSDTCLAWRIRCRGPRASLAKRSRQHFRDSCSSHRQSTAAGHPHEPAGSTCPDALASFRATFLRIGITCMSRVWQARQERDRQKRSGSHVAPRFEQPQHTHCHTLPGSRCTRSHDCVTPQQKAGNQRLLSSVRCIAWLWQLCRR